MSISRKDHTQFFAQIRIHGLTKSSNGTPCSINLERRCSFPMPADRPKIFTHEHEKDLSACLLAPRYDIEARVCFDCPVVDEQDEGGPLAALGSGRAGIVYPLEILSLKRATSQTWDNKHPLPSSGFIPSSEETEITEDLPTLPPLCIKVAHPGYARQLAREAWFYEQLDARGLTGHVSPRCYGVFHSSHVPDEITIDIPGYDYYERASKPMSDGSRLYTAPLSEEYHDEVNDTLKYYTAGFLDDVKESHTKSEWKRFVETPAVTTMTVIVMDMLGASLTKEDYEQDWGKDISTIWDHLTPLDIVHADIRFPNVLRVPPHLQIPCPMHPDAISGHKWNVVDWEEAKIVHIGPRTRFVVWNQRHNLASCYEEAGGKQEIQYDWDKYHALRAAERSVDPGCHKDQLSKA